MRRGAVIGLALVMGLVAFTGAPWGGANQGACAAGDRGVPYPEITRGKGDGRSNSTLMARRSPALPRGAARGCRTSA